MALIAVDRPDGRIRNVSLKDQTGKRFGRLVVIALHRRDESKENNHVWRCRCDCGGEKLANVKNLRSGKTSSCGCLFLEGMRARNTTHGLCRTHPREYRIWKNMRARCASRGNKSFPDYGGRGIYVCERWAEFPAFIEDMGAVPDGGSIDRIDVNGPYSPDNCRWASATDQARNKRSNHLIEYHGETKTLQEWCNQFCIEPSKARYRLRTGWDIDDVFKPEDGRRTIRLKP